MPTDSDRIAYVIAEMRGWVADCEWADGDTLEQLSDDTIVAGVHRHYDVTTLVTHQLEVAPEGWHCTCCEFIFTSKDVAAGTPCIPAWIVALRRVKAAE